MVTITTRANKEISRPHSTGPTLSVTTVTQGNTRGKAVPLPAEQCLLASLEAKEELVGV